MHLSDLWGHRSTGAHFFFSFFFIKLSFSLNENLFFFFFRPAVSTKTVFLLCVDVRKKQIKQEMLHFSHNKNLSPLITFHCHGRLHQNQNRPARHNGLRGDHKLAEETLTWIKEETKSSTSSFFFLQLCATSPDLSPEFFFLSHLSCTTSVNPDLSSPPGGIASASVVITAVLPTEEASVPVVLGVTTFTTPDRSVVHTVWTALLPRDLLK